ncbi:MAG: orotate phosphoribosyltransferase [Planctomycetes bacterium]|nr:orotate phosphoribosyltransferase [Planctomycetota bacterium]
MDLRGKLYSLVARCVINHKEADIKLASGRMSNFYFDGRLVSLDAQGLFLVSKLMWWKLRGRIDAVGGLTMGADPITAGILAAAAMDGMSLKGFICRKTAKEHGTGRLVEGPALAHGDRLALVDDTATTGGSFIKAAEALELQYGKDAVNIVACHVIVDREEGAAEALMEHGLHMDALFRKSDFPAL